MISLQLGNIYKQARFFVFYASIAVFAFLPQSASAAQFSGEYFIKVCSVDSSGHEIIKGGKIACQAYISGLLDYHNTLRAMNLTSDMNFCVPEEVSLNELQIRIFAYMNKRAKLHRKFTAAPGVAMALFSLYPCSGASKRQ
ncbi:MAG: hypothetical protein KAJ40_03750 [Alphaproteobacteria bacterium]|nr:hypothetical protein [Alphaproteobacteria bacterium]